MSNAFSFTSRYAMCKSLCAVLCLASNATVSADDSGSPLQKFIDRVSSRSPENYDHKLFRGGSRETLQALTFHNDNSVAITAAIELFRRRLSQIRKGSSGVKEDASRSFHEQYSESRWLTGFIEGRCKVAVPDWWQGILQRCYDDQHLISPDFIATARKHYIAKAERSRKVGKDCERIAVNDTLESISIGDGKQEISVTPLIKRIDDYQVRGIACAKYKEHVYLAMAGDHGQVYSIFCIASDNGDVQWESIVRGDHGAVTYKETLESQPEMCSIVVSDDVVYVFGVTQVSVYLEGFDIRTGQRVVRATSGF